MLNATVNLQQKYHISAGGENPIAQAMYRQKCIPEIKTLTES